jgi:heptosyltransferase-2
MTSALIIAPSWVGDAVMSQPLLSRIKEKMPGLALTAFAPPWVSPVYARMAEVSATIDNPFPHGKLGLKERWQLARALAKQQRYDLAFVLPNSWTSALLPFFMGIPKRCGFTGVARYGLLNLRHTLDKAALPLMVERFCQLAEAPGQPMPRPVPNPRLVSTPEQQAATLAALGVQKPAHKLAVFCPGAEYGPAKRWPTRHFAALADRLAEGGFAVWVLGSGKDRPLGEEIIAQAKQAEIANFCGQTKLDQAIDLMGQADAVVTNDSGLMHVAAALGRPTAAIFGSSSPGFTPPLSDKAAVVSLKLDCSPCFARTCPLGHLDCLEKLLPEQVLAALPH